MVLRERHLKIIFACAALLISLFGSACSSALPTINSGADGIAIKGYDSVAYFTMGKPVRGVKQFAYEWRGARWLFSSTEHLELFSSDPERYAPQYGGY